MAWVILMRRCLLIGLALALVTVAVPAASMEEPGRDEGERYETFEDAEAAVLAAIEAPSSLSNADAEALIKQMLEQEALTTEQTSELRRWMRDANEDGELATVLEAAVLDHLEASFQARTALSQERNQHAQEDLWAELVGPTTTAYSAASAESEEFAPHNVRVAGVHAASTDDFQFFGSFNGLYYRYTLTMETLASFALDQHATTDLISVHTGLAVQYDVYRYCYFTWYGYECYYYLVVTSPSLYLAQDLSYIAAVPSASGHLATRATDMDAAQLAYDASGTIQRQATRELTSSPATAGTDAEGTVPGGEPGVGDVQAASPVPTYSGVQLDPAVATKPAFPDLPPEADGAEDAGRDVHDQVHVRERASFGTASGDSSGQTIGFEADALVTGEANLFVVRFKTPGIGSATGGEPPASLYYDADSHFTGASGNVATFDFSVLDIPPPSPP